MSDPRVVAAVSKALARVLSERDGGVWVPCVVADTPELEEPKEGRKHERSH